MGSKLQSNEEKLFDDVFQHYLLIFHLAVLDGQLRYCALFTPSIRWSQNKGYFGDNEKG